MNSAFKTRALTAEEIALFPPSFTDAIDIGAVRFVDRAHNPFAARKILVRGHKIFWPNCPLDFSQETIGQQALLMHELCHVWQYHTGRLTALRYLTRPKNWVYHYSFDMAKSFDDYPIEKQADLLQDWYRLNMGCAAIRFEDGTQLPSLARINAAVPFTWPQDWHRKVPANEAPSNKDGNDEPIRLV